MSTAPPIPLWRRVFAPVGHPSALADAHGFLQTRVTLYSRTLFWFLAGFTAIGVVKLLAMGSLRPDLLRFNLLSLAARGLMKLYNVRVVENLGIVSCFNDPTVGSCIPWGCIKSHRKAVVDGVSPLIEAGLLAFVGGVLLVVGAVHAAAPRAIGSDSPDDSGSPGRAANAPSRQS